MTRLNQINTILQGDVIDVLKTLPEGSIDCVITSPPYFQVRDYKIKGQWGLEKSPLEYLSKMDEFLRQIHRVLKWRGVLGLNIGDTIDHSGWIGIPESLYMYSKAIGYYGISKPVWYKRNAMPSSTKKRLSPKYEMLYLLGKTKDYNFYLDSIRVPAKTVSNKFNVRVRDKSELKYGKLSKRAEWEKDVYDTTTGIRKQDSVYGADGEIKSNYEGFNSRYDHDKICRQGKNPGDLLDITVKRNPEGHYAVFPEEIPEFVIKACCPSDGIVLDPFTGSGTTLAVAKRLGRQYLGIELKQEYINNALKRIENVSPVESR